MSRKQSSVKTTATALSISLSFGMQPRVLESGIHMDSSRRRENLPVLCGQMGHTGNSTWKLRNTAVVHHRSGVGRNSISKVELASFIEEWDNVQLRTVS